MTSIKIPGTIQIDENDKNDEVGSISDDCSDLNEIDPLDISDNKSLDFDSENEQGEHADINIDLIAGDENGYDTALSRISQEISLADHDAANKMIDESLKHRIRVISLSKIAYPKDDWHIGKYEIQLAHSYLDLKGSDYAAQCDIHAQLGLKIISSYVPDMFSDNEKLDFLQTLISAYYSISRSQIILKNTELSETNIEKAFVILKKLEKMPEIADDEIYSLKLKLILAAGKIAFRLGKLSAASNHYHEASTMVTNVKGEDSGELIPIYQFLGKIEQCNGNLSNHSKAIEYYLAAHALAIKIYESHSDNIIQTGRALATAYSLVGTIDSERSAECYLNQCLESLVLINGEHYPKVCQVQSELARLFIRCDRKMEAFAKLNANLKIEKKIFGEYSEEVMATYQLLGSLNLSDGKMDEAHKYYEKAYLIEELQNGPQSKLARNLKNTISRIKLDPQISDPIKQLHTRPRFSSTIRPK